MLGTYHLTALFDILNKLHFVYEPDQLWRFVLEQGCKTIQAETGSYLELTEDEKELRVAAAYGIDEKRLNKVQFKVGVGVSGWVAQFHQPALVNDVRQDNRFNRAVDHQLGFNTKSILCTPVLSQKRNYGVIEAINRKSGQFSPQDQEFLTLLGRQAAVAYQNLLLIEEVSRGKVWLESLVGNLSGGLMAINAAGRMTILNPSAAQLLGLPAGDYAGKPATEVLAGVPWFASCLQQTLASQTTASRQEVTLPMAGHDTRIGYSTILISDPQKKILGSGVIFQKLSS